MKKFLQHFSVFISLIILLSVAIGCRSDKAKEIAILNERHDAFRYAKKARIIINKNYSHDIKRIDGEDVIYNRTERLLKYADVRTTRKKNKKVDFIIEINIEGEAISESYAIGTSPFGSKRYTGAEVKGSIVFIGENGYRIEENFSGITKPTSKITLSSMYYDDKYKLPEEAPLSETLYTAFNASIGDIVYKAYGFTPFLEVLKKNELGSDRNHAISILEYYSGECFGSDEEKWEKWWEKINIKNLP